MNNTIHNFNDSLKIGQKGEDSFCKMYGFTKADTYDYDFHAENGLKIELKTDQYTTSPNFFMERYIEQKNGIRTAGGPWQALGKADSFIYYFINLEVFYWFGSIKRLVNELDKICINKNLSKPVKNINYKNRNEYFARGYIIPRTELKNIYTKHLFDKTATEIKKEEL